MTADVMDGDRDKATQAGMVDHIAKPLNVSQMFATLARWVAPKAVSSAPEASMGVAQTPSPAIALPVIDGLDTRRGLATVMGDQRLYARQLQRFLANYRDFATDFAAALADPDANAADTGIPQPAQRCRQSGG